MKKLFVIIGLAFLAGVNVKAQSTNVYYVLTIEENSVRINSFTNVLAAVAVKGLNVAFNSYQADSTNNTQNFRQFSKDYVKTLIENPLKDLGRNYEFQQSQIDKITTSISQNWDNASAADRKLLTDWLIKYPVNP